MFHLKILTTELWWMRQAAGRTRCGCVLLLIINNPPPHSPRPTFSPFSNHYKSLMIFVQFWEMMPEFQNEPCVHMSNRWAGLLSFSLSQLCLFCSSWNSRLLRFNGIEPIRHLDGFSFFVKVQFVLRCLSPSLFGEAPRLVGWCAFLLRTLDSQTERPHVQQYTLRSDGDSEL